MSGRAFKVRLTNDEWDRELRSWRCPALKIPGIVVEDVYYKGQPLNKHSYRIDRSNEMIYWVAESSPDDAVAVILKLTEDLSTEKETAKWRKLAIVLPVIATVLSPLLVAAFNYVTKDKAPLIENRNVNSTGPATNQNQQNSGQGKVDQNSVNQIDRWVIGLETIDKDDGGLEAAKRQLFDMAHDRGYEKNSCLLKYDDVYKVIIYFPEESKARENLAKAKLINPTVDGVKDLRDWCGDYVKTDENIYTCSKDINRN